jgi:Endonuclease IV
MIKFGPAGNGESFYSEGYKTTLEMPKWLKNKGLDVFEYSFGKGVNIGKSTAEAIGAEAAANGIEMTVHAPYYINLANPDPDKGENGFLYLLQSMQAVKYFGGNRVVFHSGAEGKQPRQIAVSTISERLKRFAEIKKPRALPTLSCVPKQWAKWRKSAI